MTKNTSHSPQRKAHLAVILTNLFFAGNFSLVKMISPSPIGPLALNLLRAGLSVGLFWIAWMFGDTKAGIRRKDLGRFLLCALTGVAVNQILFVKGLTMTSATHASLLMLVTPILVTLFAVWALKEKFFLVQGIGLTLAIGGAVFLILQKASGHDPAEYILGDVLILLNAVSYSIYFILVKPLMKSYHPFHVIRWVFTLGFIMIIPFAWQETGEIEWEIFNLTHIVSLTIIILFGTFLAYYFNIYGIQHIGAGATGTYIYTQPVFAVALAAIFLNESFGWQKALSALLIFLGVYLVSFYKTRKKNSV